MLTIGITGPTGAGKTTALREIERLGGLVLDADEIYHRLLAESTALRMELESRFGSLTDAKGAIDRKKLGGIVFRDPKSLDDLNHIAHRFVTDAVEQELQEVEQKGCQLAAVDAIGLFESGIAELCRITIAVLAPQETRVMRIMAREGISEDYAWSRVRAQRPDSFFTEKCDYTLVNDCTGPDEFAKKARTLLKEIMEKESYCNG